MSTWRSICARASTSPRPRWSGARISSAGVGAGEAPVDDPAHGEGARAPEAGGHVEVDARAAEHGRRWASSTVCDGRGVQASKRQETRPEHGTGPRSMRRLETRMKAVQLGGTAPQSVVLIQARVLCANRVAVVSACGGDDEASSRAVLRWRCRAFNVVRPRPSSAAHHRFYPTVHEWARPWNDFPLCIIDRGERVTRSNTHITPTRKYRLYGRAAGPRPDGTPEEGARSTPVSLARPARMDHGAMDHARPGGATPLPDRGWRTQTHRTATAPEPGGMPTRTATSHVRVTHRRARARPRPPPQHDTTVFSARGQRHTRAHSKDHSDNSWASAQAHRLDTHSLRKPRATSAAAPTPANTLPAREMEQRAAPLDPHASTRTHPRYATPPPTYHAPTLQATAASLSPPPRPTSQVPITPSRPISTAIILPFDRPTT